MSAGCDQNRGSALNKRLRPLIPKPPGNKLLDGQSHFGLTADAASEACIVRRRNLISEDVEMPTPTYFCTSSQKLQTQKSDLLRLNSGREAGTCRVLSLSSRWNPTTDQLKMLEDLYKRGIRTPSAEQIQYITAQLRRYGKIEGKNVFYWFQNHKARERQKRRRRMEMLQLEAVPAIHLDTVKPSEVAAGSTDSHWMISSSPLATSSILAKEPESLKSFLKLAMPSAEEDEEGEHRRTTLLSRRYNSAPVRPSYIITQKYFQQRHNSGSVNAGDSELIYDGPQSSKGVNQDDGGGFLHANPIATERCSTLRIDGLQTLELFPLRSCSSTAEEDISLVQPAGSESSLVSCQMEPNSSASLSCSSCTDEKRNSTSPQHNRGFGSIKHDGDTIGSRTDDEDEQLIYVKRDAQEKRQQLPCRFFQFLPLRM